MALNRDRAGKAGAIPFSALLSDAPWQISRYHRPALGAQLTHQLHNLCILLHIRSALTRCWSLRTRQMSDDEHYQHFASRDWRRTSGDQGPLMSSGLSTFCHLCRHWTSVLSTKCSAAWQGTLSAPQPTEAPHRFILLPQKHAMPPMLRRATNTVHRLPMRTGRADRTIPRLPCDNSTPGLMTARIITRSAGHVQSVDVI